MMKRFKRPDLDAGQKTELWRRWQAGESATEIARALGWHEASISRYLRVRGGIVPIARRRCARSLSLSEREAISRGIVANHSIRRIAAELSRSPSTVSREIERNGGRSRYWASQADSRAWDRARRPKPCRLSCRPRLRWEVARKLRLQWSPEQISGWLRLEFPDDEELQVSHETIYRSLYVQAKAVLKKELLEHLRQRRRMRHSMKAGASGENRGKLTDAVSIRERPAEVEDRAVPGHWEGDLLTGAGNTYIATLVERQTRFVMLVKVGGKHTDTVVAALARQIQRLPSELRRSLTWDRGKEMTHHRRFTMATDVQVYFCDPRSPWQRGSNENTNGLLRQYFPKGTDLSVHTQAYLNKIALRLNERPRKTLDFQTPANKLNELLH